jgi:AraC-like DNA-binding protein
MDWCQLDRGPLVAELQQVGLPSVLLSRFHCNRKFSQRGAPPPGMRTFAILTPDSPPVAWGREDSSGGRMVVFPTEEDYRFVSRPGFAGDTISISEKALWEAAALTEHDPQVQLPEGQGFLDVDGRLSALLRKLLTTIHTEACSEPSPAAARDNEVLLASTLLSMLEGCSKRFVSRPTPLARRTALNRALDYIEEHASEAPPIKDLCRAAGTSWRTLDYAFREQFGTTPKQFLVARRLAGVRRELLRAAPGATVSEVAARWGFRHPGWFGVNYRAHFGELPSTTLRRRVE